MRETAEGSGKVVFQLAVLVYREEVSPGQHLWFARSVMTSDLGFGQSDKEAIESLKRIFDTSISVAHRHGMTPDQWLAAQTPDEPRWIETWLRLWVPPKSKVVKMRPDAGDCEIEVQIAWGDAA